MAGAGADAGRWEALRGACGRLGAAFGEACAEDLEGLGRADAAGALRRALGGEAGAAEEAAAAAWARLEGAQGWDHPAWRELYVLGQACLSVELGATAEASGDAAVARKAMKCVDMAFIMGGPPEVLGEFAEGSQGLLAELEGPCSLPPEARPLPDAPPADAPCVAPEHVIPRVHCPSLEVFREEYFKKDKPVVITGACESWGALQKWRDLNFIVGTYGRRHVPLEVGQHYDSEWREEVMEMREFALRHLLHLGPEGEEAPVGYLAQHPLFDQLPALTKDFEVPRYTRVGEFGRACAWVGPKGTVTPCHFDSYDIFLTQAVGYKFIKLFAFKDSKYLYRSQAPWVEQRKWPGSKASGKATSLGAQGNISQVDVENPDHERFPLFKEAHCMETVLGPGEMLYIPMRCWHHVRSLTTSISVNFTF